MILNNAANIMVGSTQATKIYLGSTTIWEKASEDSNLFVDLGLPSGIKWAIYNLGASAPEEIGLYFQWGDTAGYEDNSTKTFAWTDYKWCPSGDGATMTKYNSTDKITTLEAEDDAAVYILGGNWRMPTNSEYVELFDNCTATWTSQNGMNGLLLTSNVSGYTDKSIFFPAAGYYNASGLNSKASQGAYWSSVVSSNYHGKQLFFNSSGYIAADAANNKYMGCSIRPVISV